MGSDTVERRLQAANTDWGVTLVGEEGDQVDNFVVSGGPNVPYHLTLVDSPKKEGVGGATGGRTCIAIEHDPKGKGWCGLCLTSICRSKNRFGRRGRWHVVVDREIVFVSETETKEIIRATRASVVNPAIEKLAENGHIEVGFAWSNPRRIGGPPIKLELEVVDWKPQLAAAGRLMDIAEFADRVEELIGPGTLLKACRKLDKSIAREVLDDIVWGPDEETA